MDSIQSFYSKPKPPPVPSSTSHFPSLSNFSLYKRVVKKPDPDPSPPPPPSNHSIWYQDPVATLVIGGATFGYGIFGLILSFLPPKVKKLLSWVGLTTSHLNSIDRNQTILERNRSIAWLSFSSACCHWEMHGKLASLALLTYRSAMLKAVGWLASRQRSIDAYEALIDSLANKELDEEGQGTLWILHRSKLLIIKGDIVTAERMVSNRLQRVQADHPAQPPEHDRTEVQAPQKFKQTIGVLSYEFALICVRLSKWYQAGEAFLRMKKENAWSHVTYQFAALGCFLLVEDRSDELQRRIDDLFEELPALFSKKKTTLAGETPPHELLISQRLMEYKAKHHDLVLRGLIKKPDRAKCYWDSIQISPMEELSLVMSVYEDSPRTHLISNIERLSSLRPAVDVRITKGLGLGGGRQNGPGVSLTTNVNDGTAVDPQSERSRIPRNQTTSQDQAHESCLSNEELAWRDLLLGVQLMYLEEFEESRRFLNTLASLSAPPQPTTTPTATTPTPTIPPNTTATSSSSLSTIATTTTTATTAGSHRFAGSQVYISSLIYRSLVELKELDYLLSLCPSSEEASSNPDRPERDHHHHQEDHDDLHPDSDPILISQQQQQTLRNCLLKLDLAQSFLDSILKFGENYPMKGRIESKVQLIKDEIDEKRGELKARRTTTEEGAHEKK